MAAADSIVAYDETCDFSIQNLPYGVFSTPDAPEPRVGVAIGDSILDLSAAASHFATCPTLGPVAADIFSADTLNPLMDLGREAWTEARAKVTELLTASTSPLSEEEKAAVLVKQAGATMHMPIAVSEFTDAYASYWHAFKVGTMIRGAENAIKPNWKTLPVMYHARASTIELSPTEIVRPWGQAKTPDADAPTFGPERLLDFELEMGIIVGSGNKRGEPIKVADAANHLFGMVLLNDWSARGIQVWEYVPLGPFTGKNLGTTISPWVVTFDALAPFAIPAQEQDPAPHPYLADPSHTTYDINLSVALTTAADDTEMTISNSNLSSLYWTPRQMLAHHSSTGCAMNTGDVIGTGTISGPSREESGCMLEISERGKNPLTLPNGEVRKYLADGDTVILRGYCQGDGFRVGFGETRDLVAPALPPSYWGLDA